MAYRPTISRTEAARRLELLFPRAAFDTVLSSPQAAAAVVAMLYVDAVVPDGEEAEPRTWARPSMCLWMSDAALNHSDEAERAEWAITALRGKRALTALHARWDEAFDPWYGDNSRETLRDETFQGWRQHGILRERHGIPTTSSKPRWALAASFADLLDPGLDDETLLQLVESWRSEHMNPAARLQALRASERLAEVHEVVVSLPGGRERSLSPGDASRIIKGVIEEWVPARLDDPVVLSISEPGDKLFTEDKSILDHLGVHIDVTAVLPDVLAVDLGPTPAEFWIVEVVATDGPIDTVRRNQLEQWAVSQGIEADQCRYLSAFASRNASAARRRLKDLAEGTFAWYLDEPQSELAWYEIS